jgi:hypothetical protein
MRERDPVSNRVIPEISVTPAKEEMPLKALKKIDSCLSSNDDRLTVYQEKIFETGSAHFAVLRCIPGMRYNERAGNAEFQWMRDEENKAFVHIIQGIEKYHAEGSVCAFGRSVPRAKD